MGSKCVALFSGGLDSVLAVRIMQQQGVAVEALNFKTVFECCQETSARAARELGVRLTVLGVADDYLELIRNPRFGYGKGANPCVDCRIYMFRQAAKFMQQVGARFVVSGEIVGQRPMSQKRRDLDVISRDSGLDDLLLRPLCAKLLPATRPEREGLVDRERLYDFQGRRRNGLVELAGKLGIARIPDPSTGCALTEPLFSRKVFDLLEHAPESPRWDFELLPIGRHFRLNEKTKVVLGRTRAENDRLHYVHDLPQARSTVRLDPGNFLGPHALVIGPASFEAIEFAAGLILRYARQHDPDNAQVDVVTRDASRTIRATIPAAARHARTLSSPSGAETGT